MSLVILISNLYNRFKQVVIIIVMEKVFDTLQCMIKDRNYTVTDNLDFGEPVIKVNDDLIVIFVEEAKVGINTIKNIEKTFEETQKNHAIIIYNNSITAFAKQSIIVLESQGKKLEFFKYDELTYNITKHKLVPKHILISNNEKRQLLKHYKVNETQLAYILKTDPVARYYNAKPGNVFKIITHSDVTQQNITYRVVV